MSDAAPVTWLDRAENWVGRPVSLLLGLAGLVTLFSSAWFLLAKGIGIDPSLLLRTLLRDILFVVILYSAAAILTVREALIWYRRPPPKRRAILAGIFGLALLAIAVSAYGDVRIRTRESLVAKEVGKMRGYGCTGDYARSLKSIDALANSSRFNFLKADLQALANHERFLVHLKSGFAPTADAVTLAERHLLFGQPNRAGRPPEIRDALWRRWQNAIRPECR